MRLRVASATDVGKQRERNEDCLRVFHGDERLRATGRGSLFAVADGLGGHRGGAEAARMAVDQLYLFFQYPRARFAGYETLVDLVRRANRAVHAGAQTTGPLHRMGCTLSALHVDARVRQAFTAHVGDSRIYRLRDGQLLQLTEDHTDPEHRHVLFNHIGLAEEVRVDTATWPLRAGDRWLLCSDGLNAGATDDEVRHALAKAPHPEVAASALIALAAREGLDNASVIVVEVLPEAPGG